MPRPTRTSEKNSSTPDENVNQRSSDCETVHSNQASSTTTQLLEAIASGDECAIEKLFPIVYDELHRLANSHMRSERKDHTLQPTALIHEAYLRLVKPTSGQSTNYSNLEHFMATASVMMRRILINHAKSKLAKKRRGNRNHLQLDSIADEFNNRSVDLLALDEAMSKLEQLDPTQHRLVELRFFGGLSFSQCSQILGISERQIYYEWSHARAWLQRQLEIDS